MCIDSDCLCPRVWIVRFHVMPRCFVVIRAESARRFAWFWIAVRCHPLQAIGARDALLDQRPAMLDPVSAAWLHALRLVQTDANILRCQYSLWSTLTFYKPN